MRSETRTIRLGSEQRAAIDTPGNLLLRAGAGSGKTEVLARRFVALAAGDGENRAPLEPVRIAAITFTERAALDMRLRIAQVLHERIENEPDAARREQLGRAQRMLPLARISTIHAFCARLLRENAFAARLDPDFVVLDEYESNALFERVCSETLVDAVRRRDEAALMLVRTRRMHSSSPQESAIETVERVLFEARRKGLSTEWIVQRTEQAAQAIVARESELASMAADLARLIEQLLTDKKLGISRDVLEKIDAAFAAARPILANFGAGTEPDELEAFRKMLEVLPHARGRARELILQIRNLVIHSTAKFGLAGTLIAAWGEQRGVKPSRQMAQLLAKIDQAFEAAKLADRVLTFDDLLMRTRDLLRDRQDVTWRLREEFGAILVDEYQDVDRVQHEIITALTEPLAKSVATPELFIVGDEKQSIYRFRGAEVSVFNQPRGAHTMHLPLRENRRSTPNLLKFVNALSGVAMCSASAGTPAPYEVVWHGGHELKPVRTSARDYPVEIITGIDPEGAERAEEAPDDKLNASAKRQLEARAIANRIGDMLAAREEVEDPRSGELRPVALSDIVVLFRAFTDIALYEHVFAEAGIDCYTVKGRGFYHQREVIDLIELLAAIDDPRDSIALAAALRSPFFSVSDECLLELALRLHQRDLPRRPGSLAELFSHNPDFSWLGCERELVENAAKVLGMLREARERLSLPEVIELALEQTDYDSVIAGTRNGRQRVANLRKLAELAYQFDSHHLFTFHDFVRYLRRLTEQEPYEAQAQTLGEHDNVVRLMTVHQAKGLEFPIVIVADAGRRPNMNFPAPLLDRELGLVMCETDGSGDDAIPNAALIGCRERIKAEEEAESVRALYVAITRARDRLIISEGASNQGWSKPIRRFIGKEALASLENAPEGWCELECGGARVVLRRADSGERERIVAISETAQSPDKAEIDLVRRRLTGTIVGTGELTITPTEFADYERCPRQYWFRHGLGLPERAQVRTSPKGDAPALGSVAHAIMERVNLDDKAGASEAELLRIAESLAAPAGIDIVQCKAVAHDLARYIASRSGNEQVIGREVPFMMNLAPRLFVRGQIDAIVRIGAGLLVRDYKYISHPETAHYQVQMECYALAVAMVNPGYPVEAELVALRSAPAPMRIALPSMNQIREDLIGLGHEIAEARKSQDYPKKPVTRSQCFELGCGYVARCWKD
jgi:ATP-dependent helicase/nuclease subunit A